MIYACKLRGCLLVSSNYYIEFFWSCCRAHFQLSLLKTLHLRKFEHQLLADYISHGLLVDYISRKYTCTYLYVSGGKKCSFFRKFGALCFIETPVLRFAILPYYRPNIFHYFIFTCVTVFIISIFFVFHCENM